MRRVILFLFFSERAARAGERGGGRCQTFSFGETTQQGTPFYPAGMSAADWSTLVFTLPRRKMAWVHPTKATFFQNCTLILDKYPVVSENKTLPPAISPAEITLRSRQRAPKHTSSRAKHTVRNQHQ